ncbi:S8 family peptidase, partial [bacterium]|nr:S8 family peptidase [bacterium]
IQVDGDPTPDPVNFDNSHGTHVAGIAAATRNNGRGVAGVAGARVMGVRCGVGSSIAYGYEGVYYACRAGARIINCSWGGGTESAYEREIVRYVTEQGCVVVAAAGNQGQRLEHYPSAIEGTLSVAATRSDDGAAQFTNYGPWVKISAPGVFIVSTIIDQNGNASYSGWQGTSMAAPVVAGVCALVLSRNPTLSSYELISHICATSDNIEDVNIGRRGELGLGRVNAYRAVHETRSGLEFVNASYSEAEFSDGDGRIESGELGSLTISARSFDDNAGAIVYVRSRSDSVMLSDSVLMFGAMSQGGIHETLPSSLRFTLVEGARRGAVLPLALDMFSLEGRLLGRATTTLLLDSSFAVIENATMKLGIGDQGALGYFDYARNIPQGPGLALTDVANNALYHGSFFVAHDGKVIDNFFGDSSESRFDWTALDGVYAEEVETQRASHEIRTRFDDRMLPESERLGVEVELRALSWNEPGAERVLVLEARIFNRSETNWPNELNFAGFMCDWDVGASSSNLGSYVGGFDWVNGMLTVHSTESRLPWIGMVPLMGELYTAYEIANREEFGSAGPFTDARKWQIFHYGIGGFSETPRDLSHVAAQWIDSLPAGDSLLTAWAVVSGADLTELRSAANSARELYLTGSLDREPRREEVGQLRDVTIGPNPLHSGSTLKLQTTYAGLFKIKIYNILGQVVRDFQIFPERPGGHVLGTLPPTSTGILLYSIQGPGGTTSGKLLHIK